MQIFILPKRVWSNEHKFHSDSVEFKPTTSSGIADPQFQVSSPFYCFNRIFEYFGPAIFISYFFYLSQDRKLKPFRVH